MVFLWLMLDQAFSQKKASSRACRGDWQQWILKIKTISTNSQAVNPTQICSHE